MRALKSSNFHSLSLVRAFTLFSTCIFPLGAANPVAGVLPLIGRQLSGPNTNAGLPTNIINNSDGSNQGLSQPSFSDGGGSGFSAPAVLWIVFASLLGLPLAIAGVRGWRLTSAVGAGLAVSFLSWAIYVNASNGTALSPNPTTADLLLSLFVWGSFAVGAALGSLRVGVLVGISLLGACAGTAIGILLALLRPGLLIPIYAINIVPMGLLAVGGAVWPLWQQRIAVMTASSACGSFLTALAIDLVINKQSGMSQGLRFLLDRNKVHIAATIKAGYKPTLSTVVLCGVAIAIVPFLAYAQHRIFRQPFDRSPESLEAYKRAVNGTPILGPGDEGYISKEDPDAEAQGESSPKHVRLRFPSIIPSLPGNVDPQYVTQQQNLRDQRQRGNAANQPNSLNTSVPGPGIGRTSFMPYWAVTTAKRMSATLGFNSTRNRFSNMFGRSGNYAGSDRRGSNYSIPSIYSSDMNAGGVSQGLGMSKQQQPQQQQRPRYGEASYGTTQLSPIRPLQLANQPGGLYSPSKAYAPSSKGGRFNASAPAPGPPLTSLPPTSLRAGRSAWNAPPPPGGAEGRTRNARNAGGVDARLRNNEANRQPQLQPPPSSRTNPNRLKPSRYNQL